MMPSLFLVSVAMKRKIDGRVTTALNGHTAVSSAAFRYLRVLTPTMPRQHSKTAFLKLRCRLRSYNLTHAGWKSKRVLQAMRRLMARPPGGEAMLLNYHCGNHAPHLQ